ncbi:MAG: hypothetical protein P8Y78_05455 [Acidihalobacter sp.]
MADFLQQRLDQGALFPGRVRLVGRGFSQRGVGGFECGQYAAAIGAADVGHGALQRTDCGEGEHRVAQGVQSHQWRPYRNGTAQCDREVQSRRQGGDEAT